MLNNLLNREVNELMNSFPGAEMKATTIIIIVGSIVAVIVLICCITGALVKQETVSKFVLLKPNNINPQHKSHQKQLVQPVLLGGRSRWLSF